MPKYLVDVRLKCTYEVEADTEQEANAKAWDWFSECEPDFYTVRMNCWTCACRSEDECPFAENCGAENNFFLWKEA